MEKQGKKGISVDVQNQNNIKVMEE